MLDILTTVDLDVSMRYQFMGAPDASWLLGWERRFYRAAIGLAKYCLQHNTSIESTWDSWQSNKKTIWDRCRSEDDRPHVETLLLTVFARQRLLFSYLLQCTPTDLEAIYQYPDIARMLLVSDSKLATSYVQFLGIASKWFSPLLLDLLEVDTDTIDANCANMLTIPKPVSNQPLCIEI